jgi:hypothetical protein
MFDESKHPAVFYDNRFCTSPCPSFVFSEDDYALMWLSYVVPGLVAFMMNAMSLAYLVPPFCRHLLWNSRAALRNVGSRKVAGDGANAEGLRLKSESPSARKAVKAPDTLLLLCACTLYGCVAILPSMILKTELPCGRDCDVEACFQTPSMWCTVNRSSSFLLQVMIHSLAWKLVTLYLSLVNDFYSFTYRFTRKYGGWLSILLPCVCCAISYQIEIDDPMHPSYALHFVRSAFTCRMRFPDFQMEMFLTHAQIGISAGIVLLAVIKIIGVLVQSYVRVKSVEGLNYFGKVKVAFLALAQKPKVVKIMALGMTALLMLVLSVSMTILSAPAFASFHDDSQAWYECIKRHFALRNLYGKWEELLAEAAADAAATGDDVDTSALGGCPPLPQGGPSLNSQLIQMVAETLVQLLVATFYGRMPQLEWVGSLVPSPFRKARETVFKNFRSSALLATKLRKVPTSIAPSSNSSGLSAGSSAVGSSASTDTSTNSAVELLSGAVEERTPDLTRATRGSKKGVCSMLLHLTSSPRPPLHHHPGPYIFIYPLLFRPSPQFAASVSSKRARLSRVSKATSPWTHRRLDHSEGRMLGWVLSLVLALFLQQNRRAIAHLPREVRRLFCPARF